MKKTIITLCAIILAISNLMANPVGQATARKAAQGFVKTAFAETSRSDAMELVQNTDAFYVFNVGQTGFVIISADDNFRPVVGYSDEGVFPTENPSPEMMYYLNSLSRGREIALRASIQQEETVATEWQSLLSGNPMPSRNGEKQAFYLVKTRWNQNSPYNKFCPSQGGRTYAGCVATAMSQVMNYWKYPTHGYGQHSYNHYQYGQLSADFSAAEYDFDLMPNSINDASPVENIDAVALFMYHCGIAVNMSYGTDGSGANSEDVPDAVLKYFGYTNCCRLIDRDQYSLGGFQALLKDQFDRGWPVYYSGHDLDQNSGHAFVCDGYDDKDMFHFNWGWSGSGNGFFAIDELNVSSYAFNSYQGVVANFVPREVFTSTVSAPSLFTAVPNGDMDLSVTLTWTNPYTNLAGDSLTAIDQLVVMRDGVAIQTFEHPTPGEAMTFVDMAGMPITVNYTVHAVCNGVAGRKAHADGINLGPACNWTVNLKASQETGWGDGMLKLLNSSGVVLAELTASRNEESFEVEMPVGRATFFWTAPTDSIGIGMEIIDAMGQPVFAYEGPSTLMPEGLFFETVNTCDGTAYHEIPSNLTAEVVGEDVVLLWKGPSGSHQFYIVYRDGYFHTMVTGVNTYTDAYAASTLHSYFVTSFSHEGESDPSNVVSVVIETELAAPSGLEMEYLPNGKVKLTWNAPEETSQMVGYEIYRRSLGQDYKRIKSVSASTTAYTDNTVLPHGDKYQYKVIAVYKGRDYLYSSPARSLHHPDLHYVEANLTHIPSGLTLTEQNGALLLQWEEALLAETYNVYRNGELVAEGLDETQYEGVADGEPAYYQVTGLLNGVESNRSYKACYAHYAVDEDHLTEVTLYPNPTDDQVTVWAEGLNQLTVFTVTGQLVLDSKADGDMMLVSLSSLPSGVYYFRVATTQGVSVRKVVLVK